ncbi:hypothetical protein [Stenotrophomonas nematodicola]|uniref:Uncharacterized protein n=1 Tax=Stenotrophomonas nematodicola TaxID=2656746 RepID=A0ABW7CTT7_9GAMM
MRTLINEGHMIADVGSGRGQGGVSDRFGKAGDRVDRDAALRAVSTHGVDLRFFTSRVIAGAVCTRIPS